MILTRPDFTHGGIGFFAHSDNEQRLINELNGRKSFIFEGKEYFIAQHQPWNPEQGYTVTRFVQAYTLEQLKQAKEDGQDSRLPITIDAVLSNSQL